MKIRSICFLGFFLVGVSAKAQTAADSIPLPSFSELKHAVLMKEDAYQISNEHRFKSLSLKECYPSFFCRLESNWDKINRVQSRFRLGSLEYTNKLEGK